MIPLEVIRNGSITIYDDVADKQELVKEIEEYNKEMENCRKKMDQLDEIKYIYLAVNIFGLIEVLSESGFALFLDSNIRLIILLINFVLYVVFAAIKSKFKLSTAATALYILINKMFAILFVINLIILLMHELLERQLKAHIGYPVFAEIFVKYERGKHIRLDWDEQ